MSKLKKKRKNYNYYYILHVLYVIHKTDDKFKFTIETEKERHYFLLQKKNTQQTDQISKKPRKN